MDEEMHKDIIVLFIPGGCIASYAHAMGILWETLDVGI
jgi:hypothetical protein